MKALIAMYTFVICLCLLCMLCDGSFVPSAGVSGAINSYSPVSWSLQNVSRSKRTTHFGKIMSEPECGVLKELCNYVQDESVDIIVLGCVQELDSNQVEKIPEKCQNTMWKYMSLLMDNVYLSDLVGRYCSKEVTKQCPNTEQSSLLSCIMDIKVNMKPSSCKRFLMRLELVVFSNFRLLSSFVKDCKHDIEVLSCGRVNKDKDLLSQDETLSCLQRHIDTLDTKCQQEILHVSELQAENIQLDKQLRTACATDQLKYCPDLSPGSGLVYRCLQMHKTSSTMSKACQEELSKRQKLIAQDYRVSRGLSRACKEDIRAHHCRKGVSDDKDVRLAQILVCLEAVVRNNSKISPECQAEMVDHRKMLMEDYRLSPEIVHDCANDIKKFCTPIEIGGKTIHCLMEHSRPKKKKELRVEASCQRALESLVKQTDAGEDWRVDPVLRQACKQVVDMACKEVSGGEGRVMNCLMEKVGSAYMTEECEAAVLQVQYFVARDFRLDPQLYAACKQDAVSLCHAKKGWTDEDGQMDPERGPLILPCLYRYAYQNKKSLHLTSKCFQEIRRVMRQRAISVDLQPEVEDVCLDDLIKFCLDKTDVGEEMLCLQNNLESLREKCRIVISNYTETQAGHVELNPLVMKYCSGVMDKFCPSFAKLGKDDGGIMDCLISHKNEPSVRSEMKCRAVIEHFQLISLKDYHFTYRFKEACRLHVMRFCSTARLKSEVISCLSEIIRNDTIDGNKHSIQKDCRQQLRTQLFQQKENIDYDPKLMLACKSDLKKFCDNVEHGESQALECLQHVRKQVSVQCQQVLFNLKRQEFADNSIDYNLNTVCNSMISLYCRDSNPSNVLECLKIHKEEVAFDVKCKLVVVHRMIDQNTDYRFNPALQTGCKPDIKKFCTSVIAFEPQNKELQGKVITCLKSKFIEGKLSSGCEHQVASVLKEQALNFHLDPLLSLMCRPEIETICKPSDNSETNADGEVEECLKQAFVSRKIISEECRTEVANLIAESRADIQADPLLQRSCAVDLLRWCNHLEQGNGRHIRCLQMIMADEAKKLEDDCKLQLKKRMDMFKAAQMVAPENFGELYAQVASSPAKRYFLVVLLTFLGFVFIVGMFCGRASRRASYMKKK